LYLSDGKVFNSSLKARSIIIIYDIGIWLAAICEVYSLEYFFNMRFIWWLQDNLLDDIAYYFLFLLTFIELDMAMAQRFCNGSPALCDKPYSSITMMGAHNSPFSGGGISGTGMTSNQWPDVTGQLDMGIRFLSGQVHASFERVHLCHTNCFLRDAGKLTTYLNRISDWLDNNPREVVSLLLANPDGLSAAAIAWEVQQSGIKAYTYSPDSAISGKNGWPTFRQLIETNSRFILFLDSWDDSVPYILPEWRYFFETPFSQRDPKFHQCRLDRPLDANPDELMYLVNHTLDFEWFGLGIADLPDTRHAKYTNSLQTLLNHTELCRKKWDRLPNVMLLDFVDQGEVMAAQATINGM
jgi:hypothetical protein